MLLHLFLNFFIARIINGIVYFICAFLMTHSCNHDKVVSTTFLIGCIVWESVNKYYENGEILQRSNELLQRSDRINNYCDDQFNKIANNNGCNDLF